jgi:hypothetical protein
MICEHCIVRVKLLLDQRFNIEQVDEKDELSGYRSLVDAIKRCACIWEVRNEL